MNNSTSRIRTPRTSTRALTLAAGLLLIAATPLATWVLAGSQAGGAASRPINIVAIAKVKAGFEDRFKAAALALVAPSRADPGNISYDLHQGIDDPSTFVFYETWKDNEAINQHKMSKHFQDFLAATKDWLDGDLKVILLTKISPPAGSQ